jgi:hypothetical protein
VPDSSDPTQVPRARCWRSSFAASMIRKRRRPFEGKGIHRRLVVLLRPRQHVWARRPDGPAATTAHHGISTIAAMRLTRLPRLLARSTL